MITKTTLSSAVPAALLLLSAGNAARPSNALSLFGFGSSAETRSADDAKARDAAVALIKQNAAADDFVPPATGVGRQDAARFAKARAEGKLSCSGGAAGSSAEISWDRINDDFCDCPGDGGDEPGTSACSNGVFECANRGHRAVRLPSSRVGDGVCDCCDGSDEPEGACDAVCEEAAEAWVASLADRVVKVEKGTDTRAGYVEAAAKAATVRAQEIADTRTVVEDTRVKVAQAKEALASLEEVETRQRDAKLAEAKMAVSERTGSLLLEEPDRLAALAVAVASSEEPSVTLDTLCRSVLDGVDVGDALKGLLDSGKNKKKDDDDKEGKSASRIAQEEEDAFFLSENEDLDATGYDQLYGDGMMLDDDYAGYYGGGYDQGYGGYLDHGEFDDYAAEAALEAAEASTLAAAGGEGADLPVPDSEASGGKSSEGGMSADEITAGGGDPAKPNPRNIAMDDEGGMGGDTDADPAEAGRKEKSRQAEKVEQKSTPFKPPSQYKTFKFETPEAAEGRKSLKKLESEVKTQEKKIKDLEQDASADYGEDGALMPLKDKCLTVNTGGYVYRVCPFKDAHQEEGKSKTLIGKWKGIEKQADGTGDSSGGGGAAGAKQGGDAGEQQVLSGDILVFDRGQKCWNGPARSLRVALACGTEDALSAVSEPETCTYTAVLETPAACSPALRDALIASSRVDGVAGGWGGDHERGENRFARADAGAEGEL
ncbi:unnamed protein product [Scytosiphon promiscuus]